MKKLNRKLLAGSILITLLLLSGCSSKQSDTRKETTAAVENIEQTKTDSSNSDSAEQTEKKVIKIAYLPLTHAIPLFETAELLAQKDDSTLELELVKFGSWPELLDALNSGSVDGASVLVELAMKAKAQGIGLKTVALGHKDGNAIIVANDIDTVQDLKGKRFAIPHRLSSHNILLHEMLTENNMSIEDVEVVELSPAEMPSALAGGQISGYCVAEPFGAKAVTAGIGKALYQSGDLWEDSLCCGLVLRDDFIDNNVETAKTFAQQYIEAGNQLTEETTNSVAKKYLTVDEPVIDLSLQWISFKDLNITKETYQSLVDKMETFGISDSTPSYDDFIYSIQ